MNSSQAAVPTHADRVVAAMIAAVCVAMIVAIAHHPVAQGANAVMRISSIRQQGGTDETVHGTILVLLLMLASGMSHYSLLRGIEKPTVLTAALTYGLATALTVIAGAFDGFVVPALAAKCPNLTGECLRQIEESLSFASLCVQVFSRIGLLLMALATILWAVDLIASKGTRLRGAMGLAIAFMQVWLLSGVAYVLTARSLLSVMLAQIAWYCLVAGSVAGWPFKGSIRTN